MVYMDPGELGWKPLVKTWIAKFQDKMTDETTVRHSQFIQLDHSSLIVVMKKSY